MTQTRTRKTRTETGTGTGMRIVVPLQGVVQGRGGLFFGSVIPCALFYFLQLYLKRNRPGSEPDPDDVTDGVEPVRPPSPGLLERSYSRSHLFSPRGSGLGPAQVSGRVGKAVETAYFVGLGRVEEDPFDEVRNPDGVIQLGLAGNQLGLDLVKNWMMENANESIMSCGAKDESSNNISEIANYQPFDGMMDLKIAVAEFMSGTTEGRVNFDPSKIVLTAGASSAIEILSFCLADHGNAFLVPAPYYPSFDRDVKWRTGVELIPIPCRSADNFNLSITALDHAYTHAKKRGLRVRAILISNPSSSKPLSLDTLLNLLDFAADKNIHIISDETFIGSKPRHCIEEDHQFISVAQLDTDPNRVHIVYNLSNDLSIPGFNTAVIYTQNDSLSTAARKMSRFSSVSGLTQRILLSMLSDSRLVQSLVEATRERAVRMCVGFARGLRELGIETIEGGGGLYCWADMSGLIRPYSEKGEVELWEKLLNVGKVNVIPGSSCHCVEPGWFRCCFRLVMETEIPVVMDRIRRVVDTCKSR